MEEHLRREVMTNQLSYVAGCALDEARQLLVATEWHFDVRVARDFILLRSRFFYAFFFLVPGGAESLSTGGDHSEARTKCCTSDTGSFAFIRDFTASLSIF